MGIRINTGEQALDAMIGDFAALWGNYPAAVCVCSDKTAAECGITGEEYGIVLARDAGWAYSPAGRTFLDAHSSCVCLTCPVSYEVLWDILLRLSGGTDTAGKGRHALPIRDGVHTVIFRPENNSIAVEENEIILTPIEYALFTVLYANRGEVVSREALIRAVWNGEITGNRCDVHLTYLRRKLTPVFGKGALTAVRGTGYIFHG